MPFGQAHLKQHSLTQEEIVMSIIFGHRGASGHAPENTLEAFQLAMDMGADGIELDVHLSRDGELVVIHDETVDRTTNGTGFINSMTMEQLKKLDASKGMAKYKGAKIPTLGEVYDLLRPTRAIINVEIKTDTIFYPDIERKCLELEKEKGMEGRIIYSSFNHYSIVRVLELDSGAQTALLYSSGLYQPWNYTKSVGARYIHPYCPNLFLPDLITGCRENGVGINAWTVNDMDVMRLCLKEGVGIITDYPDSAVSLRKKG